MDKIQYIEHTINSIDQFIKDQLPESKYQFELYDLITNTRHFRGLDEPFHWGSMYKLFVVATVLKKMDIGDFRFSEKIELKGQSKGAGIVHKLSDLQEVSLMDACKLTIALSDALISDLLFQKVGNSLINKTTDSLEMKESKITDNLELIISKIQPQFVEELTADYLYSQQFYQHYEKALSELLIANYTTVRDINIGLNNLCSDFFSSDLKTIFYDILQMPNVWSRFSQYTFFSNKIKMFGKTGTLGFGIVANECAVIFDISNNSVLGYFTILSKENKKSIYQVFDTIGLFGLEICKLYEQLYA